MRLSFLYLPLLLVLHSSCGKQGEGERCDTRNANFDCDTGLVCRSASQLSLQGDTTGFALCCPPEGSTPSVPQCFAGATDLPEEEDRPEEEGVDAGGGGSEPAAPPPPAADAATDAGGSEG